MSEDEVTETPVQEEAAPEEVVQPPPPTMPCKLCGKETPDMLTRGLSRKSIDRVYADGEVLCADCYAKPVKNAPKELCDPCKKRPDHLACPACDEVTNA